MRARLLFAALLSLCACGIAAADEWQVLKDCRLLPHGSNDGDSFHVQCAGKEYLFRLYFVDAPETETSFPARVAEQAKYFDITSQQAVQLGEIAAQFTREKLARPFTVRTAMQDARGQSRMQRFFAFVEAADGDLAELLVANGLARVYGAAAELPGLGSPERQRKKLDRLEAQAKSQKLGGWGAAAGGMTKRAATQPSRTGADSFDAFFGSRTTPTPATATPVPRLLPAATIAPTATGKLDVNTATAEQLQSLKGIGPKKYEQIRSYFRD